MANIKSIPPQQEGRIIARVSALTILGNILLTVFKLFAGIMGHSGAMVSDAIHSMSDVAATAITYFGILSASPGRMPTNRTPMAMNGWNVWYPSCWACSSSWWAVASAGRAS